MTELERLTVLIEKCAAIHESGFDPDKRISAEALARYLLSNGVVLPPVKVGDKVWLVFCLKSSDAERWFMVQDGVQRLLCGVKGISVETWDRGTYTENEFGKTVFLVREEAEAELEKRRKEANTP